MTSSVKYKKEQRVLLFTLLTGLIAVNLFLGVTTVYAGSPTGVIYSDPSDGRVRSDGAVFSGDTAWVGDGRANRTSRGFFKFQIPSSLPRNVKVSAKLYLYLHKSKIDDVDDLVSPLQNIGLGDCLVQHISDYGTLGSEDFDVSSIGNDPGILIGNAATPNIGYVEIDVTAAMQDDLDNDRSYVTFMVLMSTTSDYDALEDHWNFRPYEYDSDNEPYIEYSFDTVGGEIMPINTLQLIMPYILLLVTGIGAAAFLYKRRIP